MRFALTATVVVAVLSAPLVAAAAGPRMHEAEFVSAVRCVAYSGLPQLDGATPELRAAEYRLNAEAQAQAPETRAKAQAAADAIYGVAPAASAEDLRLARNAACGLAGAVAVNRTLAPGAV